MFVLCLLIGLIACCCAIAIPVIRPNIATFNTNGSITGTILPGYRTPFIEGFLGIPFAEPPIGDLSYRDPRPFPNFWSHDHIANREHEMCIQKNYANPSGDASVDGTEDCLYLNIFRPVGIPSDRLLPVFINIHGGAFITGWPTTPMYGPKFFMDYGNVILVAPAYRLGPIGFLSTGDDEMPGNFAFKDQVLAMQWIKENIILFNGDPNQITLFGQSAGGVSVHMHMVSPLSNGLFNRVISASGTAIAPFSQINQDPLAQTRELAKVIGITNYDTITTAELAAQIRATDARVILNAGDHFHEWSNDPFIVFRPVLENINNPNAFLIEDPVDSIVNGNFKNVPLLMSIVPEEGIIRAGRILGDEAELESLNENFDLVIGLQTALPRDDPDHQAKIDKIVDFYFNGTRHFGWHNAQSMIDMFGDRNFNYPFYSSYKFHSKRVDPLVNPLYLIEFNYRGPFSYSYLTTGTMFDFGVVHADDLLYLFDTLMFPLFDFDSVEAKLVDEMVNIYMNFANDSHVTRTASWLPPTDSWKNNEELPYGWEKALDQKGRPYYINHLNKTTTYEAPDCYKYDEHPPEPRVVILQRSPTMGFGFVAGSERPVIVRFVTEGGPSVNKLEPGDQILSVNGEDVKDAPRDHVIQLVRACDSQVSLLVCQPMLNCGGAGRKSTLLSATKKAKLRSRPSRVRFAESVCVNGAPLFPPSAFSLGDICVPPMANVLKVFLENGQTKSFKYDATTTVQDVVTSLRDKLCLTASEHFSLVLEHVKTLKRNKLTLLDPQETLARIASRPGAHKLRCLFRVTFVPVSAANLAQKDLNSLDYLYMQCCNDVVQERFAPELLPDVALRLAALQMHQHALANNISPTKLTVKTVEEFGLERFVPASLIEGMKRKELRRLISHFLKLNAQMTGSSTKTLTQLQAKIHYLDIVSGLPSYGAKCFSTNSRSNVESVLLISPRFGFSQISDVTKTVESYNTDLDNFEVHNLDGRYLKDVNGRITRFNRTSYVFNGNFTLVKAMDSTTKIKLDMLALQGNEYRLIFSIKKENYCQAINEYDFIYQEIDKASNFPPQAKCVMEPGFYWLHHVSFSSKPPPILLTHSSWRMHIILLDSDNMPKSISAIEDVHRVVAVREDDIFYSVSIYIQPDRVVTFSMEDRDASEFALVLAGYYKLLAGKDLLVDKEREIYVEDYAPPYLSLHSVLPSNWSYLPSAQIRAHCMAFSMPPPYHSTKKLSFDYQNADRNMNTTMNNKNHKNSADNIMASGGGGGGHGMDEFGFDIHSVLSMEILEGAVGNIGKDGSLSRNGLIEARNEEVLKRVAEMQKMIENSERYLNEQGELMDEYEHTTQNQTTLRQPWQSALTNNTVDRDSDCDSLASSKVSSNEDAPPPGVLKHSDSLILLAESINHDLSGITKGLNSISTNLTQNDSSLSPIPSQQNTPKVVRKSHGLSQILNELQTLGNDLSQSESDSESISTPNNSPIRLRNTQQDHNSAKLIRTSFGLHSPDSSVLGCDTKDNNLKEYLRQLREASNNEESTDLAAKKLKELYGIDLTDDTIIETDADLIDLRAFPPPQTPDELDALTVLDAPPSGFGDLDTKIKNHQSMNLGTEPNLEEFLAKVIIAPPGQKLTPCKELTPEEIMSFIIPPPPGLNDHIDHQGVKSTALNRNVNKNIKETEPNVPKNYDKNLDKIKNKLLENNNTNFNNNLMKFNNKNINNNNSNYNNNINNNNKEESLYINSINFHQPQHSSPLKQQPKSIMTGNAATTVPTVPIVPTKSNHVIEYPTIERKGGPFSCCTKSKKESSPPESPVQSKDTTIELPLELPPRNQQNPVVNKPPIRPPKNPDLQYRVNSLPRQKLNGNLIPSYYEMAGEPPQLPPRYIDCENNKPIITTPPVMSSPPPKKPPLPPVPIKPILKSPIPILKHNPNSPEMLYNGSNSGGSGNSSPVRVAGIGSPHFHRNISSYRKIDRAFNQAADMSNGIMDNLINSPQIGPIPAPRTNGHYRSLSDCPPVCLQNPGADKKPQLSLLCSPQMSRKLSSGSCSGSSNSTSTSLPSSPQLSNKNGHVLNAETLLTKTTIAMDGLLVKLDQVAANCSAAQSAGGGNCIDEQQYQVARDNLTEYGLQLVSSSKLLVVSLSDVALTGLPENLTSCLTAFRSITELAKDLSKFTSTPLQTRNIVLKVHDVASSFRELVSCKIGPLGAGQLALQAECLANALASLLRSLRVFSP